ncbi:NRAMP family divalent metal transporter [Moraxella bovis]|uniref:Divalent metal cation transporter n=1 Tax=Moraxella bovis TaxID=476 RepID=A0A378PYS7_MORBO|nr:divalent metal cation transporter [Moraxella bovis]UYZ76928.1 divalent metal cation transporter [Moraxella bovis]UYZ77122.1 divalent metal cation transporter [Moraxella bovis]UYZ85602.1 divalent metal cation transporter [Moraxella bovis]UYZ93509.1 divalent metal cation transporter [Moraxella bovis]UYZ96560.1 divalent metal cation transporter [Moraxella bovis]
MTTAEQSISPQTNAQTQKLTWKAFGPGILMASAAIGGSHLVSSTQAGALYGWQLAIMIVLANFFKYPFYRFGTEYAYKTGDSLVAGYAKKSKAYLWAFFGLSVVSGVITTGAVALLCATILGFILPFELNPLILSIIVMTVSWGLLIAGHYKVLDNISKWIILALTVATILAVIIAGMSPKEVAPDFVSMSPWNLASLGFIIALMGWMPAPLEFSVITSVWTAKKIRTDRTSQFQGVVDFNVGYFTSAILALFFLTLGVFVQYGTGEEIATKGGAYIGQLVQMYTETIGSWSKILVAFIAFLCMFGTVITSADGYGRTNAESLSLIKTGTTELTEKYVMRWTTAMVIGGFILINVFAGQMASLLKFAMISSFVSAPIFAYLNYSLAKSENLLTPKMNIYALLGIAFLAGFAGLFLLQFFGIIG